MEGWKEQLVKGASPDKQKRLWKWIEDNVDYRVRKTIF